MAQSPLRHANASRGSSDPARSLEAVSPIDEQQDSLLRSDENDAQRSQVQESLDVAACSRSSSPSQDEKVNTTTTFPSRRLRHSSLVVYLALAYTAIAIFAWSIICVLVYRPITTRHYGLWFRKNDISGNFYPAHEAYAMNERWLQVARVLQAIVTVATIPLASAVCSSAAVVFIQRRCRNGEFSLRQTVVLADKGWTELEVYGQLLRGRSKQYGSRFLYLAIALNVLGAPHISYSLTSLTNKAGGLISPLQSVFTTTRTVQTPANPGRVQKLTDFADRLNNTNDNNDDIAAATLRAAMISTSSTDPQNRLWTTSGAENCTGNLTSTGGSACAFGQISLSNISALDDPFLAQLPAGYSTGLIRQFLPRINSSVTRVRIAASDFPADCDYTQIFFANYSSTVPVGYDPNFNMARANVSWRLIACMPGNQTSRPSNWTRVRQDFSEELYLNLSAWKPPTTDFEAVDTWSGLFKITLNTSTGYFELPNYTNGQRPGPLLTDDPSNHCGRDCILQGGPLSAAVYDHNNTISSISRRADTESDGTTTIPDSAYDANSKRNKGPLLTIALALFGTESFVADRVAHPKLYINAEEVLKYYCIDRVPFTPLLSRVSTTYDRNTTTNFIPCISNAGWNTGMLQMNMVAYVQMFINLTGSMPILAGSSSDHLLENAFEAAAFLANEQWLTSASEATFTVSYDHGIGIEAPHISLAGVILISSLLGVYLVALLTMASYSDLSAHWTNRLDSLAMMQYGAAIAEHLPMNVIADDRPLKILDETPGWLGDTTGGIGDVGELSLGGGVPLQAKRRYRCFDHDHDPER